MTIHPLAGKPVPKDLLVDTDNLRREYYADKPDFADRGQRDHLRRIQEEAQAITRTALAAVMG